MIKDTMQLNGFNNIKLPKLKGHIKLTLKNVHNGKTEIVEGENIVTNAVRDIMACNYFGAVDYSKLLPLWSNWYGGVLCYQNQHPTIEVEGEQVLDPNNYYPQSNLENPLIAHAGGNPIDPAHDDDLRRGNPTNAAHIYTNTSVKQVWEWGTTHGNGVISALSLTHKDTGDAGLGSNTYAFQNFQPFASVANNTLTQLVHTANDLTDIAVIPCQYDANHGLMYHIGEQGEYYQNHVAFETHKVTIYLVKLPFESAGLYETLERNNDRVDVFTVTTSLTLYGNPSYYFDYETKRLWLFTNQTALDPSKYNKNTISYSVIDCINKVEHSHGTIVSDASDLAPLSVSYNTSGNWSNARRYFTNIPKIGDYFFFPTSSSPTIGGDYYYANTTGYKKIKFTSQADQTTITSLNRYTYITPAMCGGGLLLTHGRVFNGNVGYDCADNLLSHPGTSQTTAQYGGWLFAQPNKLVTYATPVFNGWSVTLNRYLLANKMLNTTLFNLPTSVQKSSSQAMTVEYTLTEVD